MAASTVPARRSHRHWAQPPWTRAGACLDHRLGASHGGSRHSRILALAAKGRPSPPLRARFVFAAPT
eukprot:194027-Pyramimonas_sp.AAC.1